MNNLKLKQTKTKFYYLLTLVFITLVSCSSYQNTTTTDGIYDANSKTNEVTKSDNNDKSKKYEKYFGKNATKYDIQGDEVFTDIDTYKSEIEEEDDVEEIEKEVDDFSYNNNSWGEDGGETVVNVINNYSPYYSSFYTPYYYNSFYRPFYYRHYNPFAFHFGFYNSWGYGSYGYYRPYYGYNNFYSPYYNGYGNDYGYNRPYYGHNNYNDYAYGRRGSARNSILDRHTRGTNTTTRRTATTRRNTSTRTRTINNTRRSTSPRTRAINNTRRTIRNNTNTNRSRSTQRTRPSSQRSRPTVSPVRRSSSRSVSPTRKSSSNNSSSRSSSSRSSSKRR